jgi:hypothetical protein
VILYLTLVFEAKKLFETKGGEIFFSGLSIPSALSPTDQFTPLDRQQYFLTLFLLFSLFSHYSGMV